MIISKSRKFVFVHLEKCGGTSVENALSPYLAWDDMVMGSTHLGEQLQGFYFNYYGHQHVKENMLWKHSTIKNIYNNFNEDISSYKKIAVVRDPMELVKSLYTFSELVVQLHVGRIREENWKEVSGHWPYTEPYMQAYVFSEIRNYGFDGFVQELFKENHQVISPQINRLSLKPLDIKMDMIVDLSTIDNRWEEMIKFIGIDEKVKLEKLNISRRPKDFMFSGKTEDIIRRHFAVDYEYLPAITGVDWN
jgi:hypothetical protein